MSSVRNYAAAAKLQRRQHTVDGVGWVVPDTTSSQVRRNSANNVSLYGGRKRRLAQQELLHRARPFVYNSFGDWELLWRSVHPTSRLALLLLSISLPLSFPPFLAPIPPHTLSLVLVMWDEPNLNFPDSVLAYSATGSNDFLNDPP